MTLAAAQKNAERLLAWLGPFAVRLEIAGSVRRRRPAPDDLDVVCIPKCRIGRDLLGEIDESVNMVRQEIGRRITAEKLPWIITKGGETDGDYLVLRAGLVQVDLWFTTIERWGTVLLCR